MVSLVMRGSLDPVALDEDFQGCLEGLNKTTAKNNNFAVMDKPDGGKIMIYIPNILTIDELDD